MRRMNSFGGRTGLVLEEEAVAEAAAAEAGETGGEALPESAESVESALMEVTESAGEVDAVQESTEEAVETATALEAIYDTLKISAANGGLDKYAAQAVGIATDRLLRTVGVHKPSFPALESFGQNSSRIGATTLAMETIGEQLKKIWDAIVAAFNRAIQWLGDMYTKVFRSAEKLKARAEALKGKASGLKGSAKEGTFESAKLVEKLALSGKMEIEKGLGNLNTVLSAVAGAVTDRLATGAGAAVVASLEGGKPEAFKLDAFPAQGFEKVGADKGFAAAEGGLSIFRTAELPGGSAVVVWNTDKALTGEAAVEAFAKCKSTVSAFNPKSAESKEAKVPTLAGADAGKVCDQVLAICKVIEGFKETEKKVAELQKKCSAAASKAGKDAAKAKDDEKKKFELMKKIAVGYQRNAAQPMASLTIYSLDTSKYALDYVEQSLKQYAE